MVISTLIATEIEENKTEARKKYIAELKKCIEQGKASSLIQKLSSLLCYTPEQVALDEQSISNFYLIHQKHVTNLSETEQNTKDTQNAWEELVKSNTSFREISEKNIKDKFNFNYFQQKSERLFVEHRNIEADLEQLKEYS